MLFLLNDVVLALDDEDLQMPVQGQTLANLRTEMVSGLCAELFAGDPLIHRNSEKHAKRMAALILSKSPEINAALFLAPSRNCPVSQVACRYAHIGIDVISGLYVRQQRGELTTVDADTQVWRRLAA